MFLSVLEEMFTLSPLQSPLIILFTLILSLALLLFLDSCYRLKPLIDSRHMEGFSLEVCCCSKLCGYQFQLLANNCFGGNIKVSSGH